MTGYSDTPNSAQPTPAQLDPRTLMGASEAEGEVRQMTRQARQTLQDIAGRLDSLGQQFPTFQPVADAVKQQLNDGYLDILASADSSGAMQQQAPGYL